jgi:hypothetical protein
MSGKLKVTMVAAVAVAIAAPAAVVLGNELGGGGRPGPGPVPGAEHASLHPVGPRTTQAASAKRGSHKRVGIAYFQTKPQTVSVGRSFFRVGPTPSGCRPINGSLYGLRQWGFYRDNLTGKPVKKVIYGVVCVRGARLIGTH